MDQMVRGVASRDDKLNHVLIDAPDTSLAKETGASCTLPEKSVLLK
jgi:hypothetical protein